MDSYKYERKGILFRCYAVIRNLEDRVGARVQAWIDPAAAAELNRKVRAVAGITDKSRRKMEAALPDLQRLFQKESGLRAKTVAEIPPEMLPNYVAFAKISDTGAFKALPHETQKKIEKNFLRRLPLNNLAPESLITTYGTEMELFGLKDEELDLVDEAGDAFDCHWLHDTDGSIEPDDKTEGAEIISPVCTGQETHGIYHMATLLYTMKAKTPLPCALHVHAGIFNTFPDEVAFPLMKQILLNYRALEKDLSFLDSSLVHQYSNYDTTDQDIIDADEDDLDSFIETLNLPGYEGRRRSKVNFDALHTYGTIEFRHHPGTTNPAKVTAWITFIDSLIRKSLEMVDEGERAPHTPAGKELADLKGLVTQFRVDRARTFPRAHQSVYAATGPV